jgi:hypothetical protein
VALCLCLHLKGGAHVVDWIVLSRKVKKVKFQWTRRRRKFSRFAPPRRRIITFEACTRW